MNKEIRALEEDLVNTLNAHNLPMEVKRLVLANIMHIVAQSADEAIKNELIQESEEGKEDAISEN